jgi:RNA polymerase sigma-70 factor (ECF subfamily)
MLEIYRQFKHFRGTTVIELIAWVRQVALRTTSHTIRRHAETDKRDAARELPACDWSSLLVDSETTPSTLAMQQEQAARLTAALARLPDDMQQVLLYRHVDGLSYADLAALLGRSEGAVRVLYTRALRRLRKEYQ